MFVKLLELAVPTKVNSSSRQSIYSQQTGWPNISIAHAESFPIVRVPLCNLGYICHLVRPPRDSDDALRLFIQRHAY